MDGEEEKLEACFLLYTLLMAVLPIVTEIDNKILRTVSAPVKKIDRTVKKLIKNMIDTMIAADGLGIAAPQVGVNLRIYIARLNFNTPNAMIIPMLNTEFLKISETKEDHEEGCLSIPKRFGIVQRSNEVTIQYMDERGFSYTLNLTGLNARIMQHETDHLNGVLITDKMKETIAAKSSRSQS